MSGIAGIGKTELACKILREWRVRFPDGILHVDLDDYRVRGAVDPMETMDALLRAMDTGPEWSGHSLADRRRLYQTKTAGLELAVFIDNARYESEVQPLLPASGSSVVVVTSHGPLADLEAGAAVEIPLAPLGERDAMDLLKRASGDRRLDDDEETARELVRLCDGLPLAIRVAARHIRAHRRRSLSSLLGEFRNKLLGEGLPEVEKIWNTAYEALGSDAARLYRLLADAPGSTFTKYSAAAILGCEPDDAAAALDELDAAGLITDVSDDFGSESERMSLHALLRAHAKRCMLRDGDGEELADAQRRIVSWYLRQAQLADARAAGGRLTLAPSIPKLPDAEDMPFDNPFQWLEAERHALYGCVALAYARGLDAEAWALCEPLWTHYLDHPHYTDIVEAFGTGLAAAQRAGHVRAVVRMRCQLARPYWDNGKFEEADRELDQALAASRALSDSADDRKLKASAIEFRGRFRGAEGRWDEAAADFEDALGAHEAIDNKYGVMLLSYRLGEAAARLGESGRAAELLERAHLMAGQLGRQRMTARTGFALAGVLRGLGEAERARELYHQALASARARGSEFDEARVLDALAALADETGDAAAAREHRAAANTIRERNGASL
ncbi:MAG: hypothetical protein J2P25_13525 [Nocardiopsaceae bacterium]|nr:hypothetical protein [Nocardiopsaceae bacterium]